MTTMTIFLLGMAGALAPEITRLYSIRSKPKQFKWSWFYLLISVLFAALGGLLAVILPTVTTWGAFYVGVSTPLIISKIVEKGIDVSRPNFKKSVLPAEKPVSLSSFIKGL
jgi:hypothetical protein